MTIETNNRSTMAVMVIAVLAFIAIILYALAQTPEHRTTGDKISDAFHNVTDGFKNAGRSMENRTPAEKLGDAAKDAGDNIQRATH